MNDIQSDILTKRAEDDLRECIETVKAKMLESANLGHLSCEIDVPSRWRRAIAEEIGIQWYYERGCLPRANWARNSVGKFAGDMFSISWMVIFELGKSESQFNANTELT